jgi:hypothetical protein
MPLTSGTRLGHYDVAAPLGAGGMGEVYRATDRRLGREVALKVLPADVATDAGRLARFEREARTVAALNHPSIVTLFAAEEARAAQHAFVLAVQAYEEVGSPRGTGLALLGLAAVEAAEGRSERAVAIAAAADALSERAGVVVEHPMDPGVVSRIEALKASIPKGTLEGLVANASTLSPAAVLAMVVE